MNVDVPTMCLRYPFTTLETLDFFQPFQNTKTDDITILSVSVRTCIQEEASL